MSIDFSFADLVKWFGPFIVAVSGVVLYGRRLRLDLQKEAQAQARQAQWKIYDDFRRVLLEVLVESRDKPVLSAAQANAKQVARVTKLTDFSSAGWLTSSDEVLQALNVWRVVSGLGLDDRGTAGLYALVDIVGAMRQDLVASSRRVTRRAVLSTFVNDLTESDSIVGDLGEPAGYFASRGTWRWAIRRRLLRVSSDSHLVRLRDLKSPVTDPKESATTP